MQDDIPLSSLSTNEEKANGSLPQADSPGISSSELDSGVERYLNGWRLHTVTTALCLGFFLANIEVTIMATSLVAISQDLGNFEQSSWIINAYMLSFTGFFIIWAKLSDIYGRKLFLLCSVLIFTIFSGACGAAQTTLQLIIFRIFQGLGGSGTYSLVMVMFFELVPPSKYATYTAGTSLVLGLAMLLGPVFGGAINSGTSWRWIFLMNCPLGAILIVILLVSVPKRFPHHHLLDSDPHTRTGSLLSFENFQRTDITGTILLLGATVLLVSGMEQAGLGKGWDSAVVVCLIVIGGVLWLAFVAWEWRTTRKSALVEPVFPWRFFQSRQRIGAILTDFLLGGPVTVGMIQIPQRFQTVHHLSPLQASLRLLPFGFLVAFGSSFGAALTKKAKIPILYVILTGTLLQVIGFSLLSTIPISQDIFKGQYGYQVIAGLGCGFVLGCLVIITPFTVEERDKSVAISAVIQFRTMGGTVFLAIASSVFLNYVRSNLSSVLPSSEVDLILRSPGVLTHEPAHVQEAAVEVFTKAYAIQFRMLIGVAVAQFLAALLMWKKKQIVAY